MKHFFIALLIIFTSCTRVIAQEDEGGKNWEKIKTIRVGYITEHVHLTSEQSTKFWPVYDGYRQERRSIRSEMMKKYMSSNPGATKDQARAHLDADLDYQAKELEMKRKYKERMLQVISEAQLNQLYEAERSFRVMLLNQLRSGNGQ